MRVQIDLDDDERDAVKSYADKEGYQMSRAYAELIRQMLTLEVAVTPREEGHAVTVETDAWSTYVPVDDVTERRVVNAEYAPAWGEWQDD